MLSLQMPKKQRNRRTQGSPNWKAPGPTQPKKLKPNAASYRPHWIRPTRKLNVSNLNLSSSKLTHLFQSHRHQKKPCRHQDSDQASTAPLTRLPHRLGKEEINGCVVVCT